jgi:hypothetical protein
VELDGTAERVDDGYAVDRAFDSGLDGWTCHSGHSYGERVIM